MRPAPRLTSCCTPEVEAVHSSADVLWNTDLQTAAATDVVNLRISSAGFRFVKLTVTIDSRQCLGNSWYVDKAQRCPNTISCKASKLSLSRAHPQLFM